jgi:hypothetical protein
MRAWRRKMFQTLRDEGINIKVITTSEIKVSVLIDRKYMELAVQALHDAFGWSGRADGRSQNRLSAIGHLLLTLTPEIQKMCCR